MNTEGTWLINVRLACTGTEYSCLFWGYVMGRSCCRLMCAALTDSLLSQLRGHDLRAWLPLLMSHAVSLLMGRGFPCGVLCTSSWNKMELGGGSEST